MIMEAILLFAQIMQGASKVQGGAKVETAGASTLISIDVAPQSYIAGLGQTISFSASGNFSAPTAAVELLWEDHFEVHLAQDLTSECTWTSSNTAVAVIAAKSNPQLVNTVGAGAANITCTIGGVSGFGQLTVSGIVVSPIAIPSATINVPYSVNFSATGGVAPYTFSLTNGGAGLSTLGVHLGGTNSGTLSGTPIVAGSYAFDIQATDSSTPPHTGTRQYLLTVQPPAGTDTRKAHLPQLFANAHMGDFPVPCNSANHCDQRFIHTNGSGDYPCSVAGLQAGIDDWAAASTPTDQYREIIIDDSLSGSGCRMAVTTTPLTLKAKLGVTGWLWIHSAHPTPLGQNACGGWSAIDLSVDQTARDCPNGKPHMWYIATSPTLLTPNGTLIRLGPKDSAGNGPSHIRLSNAEGNITGPTGYQAFAIYIISQNQAWGDLQGACSQVGFDYNYFHSDSDDTGVSAIKPGNGGIAISTMVQWGCRNSWFNWNTTDRFVGYQTESKPLSLTNVPHDGQVMVVGNSLEGGIYSFFVGGACSVLGCDEIVTDVEMRKNYFAQNPAWIINGVACKNGASLKNLGELKIGVRFLLDGNVFQWSDACGQGGQALTVNVRACSAGMTCDAYGSTIEDVTVTNNVFRHLGQGIQTSARSIGAAAGLSVSKPARRWNFINNLMYDIANNARHRGATPNYFLSNGATIGSLRWRGCWALRDSAGVVTMDCSNDALQKITSITWAPTSTRSAGAACTANNCQIVTVNFAGLNATHPLTFAPYGNTDRIQVSNVVGGANLNASLRTVCGTPTNCAGNTATMLQYRCGSTADSEPACPTAPVTSNTGDIYRIGQKQTGSVPGDPTLVTGCDDTSFNTAGGETTNPTGVLGPPALPGTNGVGPNGGAGGGLIVVYQSISGAPATTENCIFRNLQGWPDGVIISHNTQVGMDTGNASGVGGAGTGLFRNPQVSAGTAGAIFPYIQNGLIQDNMDIVNPTNNGGGTGWYCCVQTEGQTSQRAGWELGRFQTDHQTFAGRNSQAGNYRIYNPTCFAAGNCPAGNAVGPPPSTFWYPSLGPCPGTTVTTSGSGWASGVSDNCPGFQGMMNTTSFVLELPGDPLTNYKLQPYNTVGTTLGNTCTANCGSPYAAGGPREASDHTDMGADMNRIRHALQRTIFDDCSAATGTCGAGPNPE